MKSTLPFTGKAISIVLIGEDESKLIIHPRLEVQGGKMFLVGTIPRGGSRRHWVDGLPIAYAWDRVQEYIVFKSVSHHAERRAVYRKKGKNRS